MGKRKTNPDQYGFAFDTPEPASLPASLAGLERQISGAVSAILHDDPRSREEIAALMSVLLADEVSRSMLDAYASPAREGHKVPASRLLALIAVCNRHDLLDHLVRSIGAAILVGEEVLTAQLGHLDRQIAQLKAKRTRIAASAPLIREGREG